MIVAINQPYFSPYSGYFALMGMADVFVIYDCVQFIRRGRIHRSQVHASSHYPAGWLTLPVVKAAQDTRIMDMQLHPLDPADYGRYRSLLDPLGDDVALDRYRRHGAALTDFLEAHLAAAAARLSLPVRLMRSSQLEVPGHFTGAARIMEICRRLKASEYLNLPGGRSLYDPVDFSRAGIALRFLNTAACARPGYLQACREGDLSRFAAEAKRNLRAL